MSDNLKERLFYNRLAWHYRQANKVKAKVHCRFEDGRLYVGQQSKHRELYARMWNCVLRFKRLIG